MTIQQALEQLNVKATNPGTLSESTTIVGSASITSQSPVDGSDLGAVGVTSREDYDRIVEEAQAAFPVWRNMPAPKRGEIVRQYGELLRQHKTALGTLVSYEMGKSFQEGLGEVQEMIDICDFAVGLSRQLYGLSMHSERPGHRMYEQWHPLGIVGIISAFNFPVAVWSWNTALAWVCGNVCIWKPSEKVPLCAIACQNLWNQVAKENNLPAGISSVINGDFHVGEMLTKDPRVNLVSATGSVRMGREVGKTVAERFGKTLLELGGNNAIIVTPEADLDLATIGITFGAVGTCGQRCTSTRRVIVHESIANELMNRLRNAYKQIRIGNPLDEKNHMGPLIDCQSVDTYLKAIKTAEEQGGEILVQGGQLDGEAYPGGCYVNPAVIKMPQDAPALQTETFAPLLYILTYSDLHEAIAIQNNVPQGLSSAIFTRNLLESETFLSANGSDCGIANVNIGTSGAEIGGAFGGEKETGGGRESGSDAWKNYMRRQTNTINYTTNIPLAQGIEFNLS